MNKLIGALVVGLVLFALAAGLIVGIRSAFEAPAVVGALAEQEQARAEALRAQAASSWAEAEKARSDAQAWRASEDARSHALELVSYAAGWGIAVSLVIGLIGAALALVRFLNVRAVVMYPNERGAWPLLVERQADKALAVLDTGRLVGPVAIIGQDKQVTAPGLASEPAQVQVTSQAQAAGVMGAALRAGKQGADLAEGMRERVGAGLRQTAEALTPPASAPAFASERAPMSSTRFVYVKTPRGNSEQERDLADLREFIEGAAVRGLGRRSWMGYKFRSGHECTRARYDALTARLKSAGVLIAAGQSWRLAVSQAEALDAFGLGDLDAQAEQEPASEDETAEDER